MSLRCPSCCRPDGVLPLSVPLTSDFLAKRERASYRLGLVSWRPPPGLSGSSGQQGVTPGRQRREERGHFPATAGEPGGSDRRILATPLGAWQPAAGDT